MGNIHSATSSLAALAFALNHAGLLLGSMHALIAVFFYLGIVLLIVRFTRLPRSALLFVTSLLILGQFLAPDFDSNIWWIFWPQTILVGKNDLLLAAGLLAVLFHTPNSRQGPFFLIWPCSCQHDRLEHQTQCRVGGSFCLADHAYTDLPTRINSNGILRIFYGVRWSCCRGCFGRSRNLLVQGRLFSPESLTISAWSIASNLNNPYLYNNLPQHFYFVLAILGLTLVVAIFKPTLRFHLLAAVLLFATFILSPASAFFGSTQERAQLAWRFAMPLLGYLFVLLMILFEPFISHIYGWLVQKNWIAIPLSVIVARIQPAAALEQPRTAGGSTPGMGSSCTINIPLRWEWMGITALMITCRRISTIPW